MLTVFSCRASQSLQAKQLCAIAPGHLARHVRRQINQRWQYYDELMQGYRIWLGDLPANVARLVAWGNGAKLFGLK